MKLKAGAKGLFNFSAERSNFTWERVSSLLAAHLCCFSGSAE